MFGIANEAWKNKQEMNILQSNKRYLMLSGDGRCDSPGHNSKYLNFSLYNQDSKKMLASSLTQVTEVDVCLNQIEKAGLLKVLEEAKGNQLEIKLLTTDRHCQIKKYMREKKEDITHQFDVWHFCKLIKVKLLNSAKKKACEELKPWVKLICDLYWWFCTTFEGDDILLKQKWTSIVFHIQNRHWWTGNLYH